MTLRPEYSLGHSEYNDFLFASVGEESVGAQLTVLTALTRLGFNAWEEAARLSDLPKDAAARDLATTIGRLPEGDWKASDAGAIAARLVGSLPARSAPAVPPPTVGQRATRKTMEPGLTTWLTWGVVAAAALLLIFALQPNRDLEPVSVRAVPTQQQ
jgi:hypothetical protein